MNEYVGKICPFCKTELKEDDDIVVCSVCDMPHHKDCWVENQGCTTFGCTGTIKSVDGSDAAIDNNTETVSTPEFVFCTNCGSKNPGTSAFCSQCGTKLINPVNNASQPAATPAPVQQTAAATAQPVAQPAPQPVAQPAPQPVAYAPQPAMPNQQAAYTQQPATYAQQPAAYAQQPAAYAQQPAAYNQMTYPAYQQPAIPANSMNMPIQPQFNITFEPEFVQLIGENSQYYINQFSKIKMTGKKESWNWSAFLLAPYWLIYRKMYSYGAAFMGATLLLPFFGLLGMMLQLGLWVCAGLYGNFVYMQYLETKVNESRSLTEPTKSRFLENNGNTNIGIAIGAAIIYFFVYYFVSYFLFFAF